MDPDFANFLHRVARSGRFGTAGLGLTFYDPSNTRYEEPHFIKKIESYLGREMDDVTSFEEFMALYYEMRPPMKSDL